MPRKAKGNRTDLNAPSQVTVPGQDYGKQAAQAQALKVVPMGNQDQATAQMLQNAPQQGEMQQVPPPDFSSLKYLHPTEQPHLPMTHGLDIGPGAGSEAMGQFGSMAHSIASLAQGPYGSPELQQVAALLQQTGL